MSHIKSNIYKLRFDNISEIVFKKHWKDEKNYNEINLHLFQTIKEFRFHKRNRISWMKHNNPTQSLWKQKA